MKKYIFILLCLSLSFSPVAHSQQTQKAHEAIEQFAKKDISDLSEAIKQLPEKDQTLVEQVLSEKKDAHELVGIFCLTIVIAAAIFTCALSTDIGKNLVPGKDSERIGY